MEQKVFTIGDQYINKNAFHKHKHLVDIDKVDTKRTVLAKTSSYSIKGSLKYFIRYITNYYILNIKPLCIKLPQINGCVKYFDSNNKRINLLVRNVELLKKYNKKWNKISNLLKTGFNRERVYDNKLKLR